jgi:hypothetical protein
MTQVSTKKCAKHTGDRESWANKLFFSILFKMFKTQTLARGPTGGPNVLLMYCWNSFWDSFLSLITEFQIYRFLLQIAKYLWQTISCSLPDLKLVCRIFVPSEESEPGKYMWNEKLTRSDSCYQTNQNTKFVISDFARFCDGSTIQSLDCLHPLDDFHPLLSVLVNQF